MKKWSSLLFLFLGSFAATATQMLFVKILESFIHHEVFSYTIIVSFAFLALASGAKKSLAKNNIERLPFYQSSLFVLTPLFSFLVLYFPSFLVLHQIMSPGASAFIDPNYLELVIPLSILFIFILNRLHGSEIPLISNSGLVSFGSSLAISYVGALVGFLSVPFILLPNFGLFPTLLGIGLVYYINCLILCFQIIKNFMSKVFAIFCLSCFAAILVFSFNHFPKLESVRKALFYANGLEVWPEEPMTSIPEALNYVQSKIKVETIESPYQTVDLIQYQNAKSTDLRMYLNGDFQFDSSTEDIYHHNFLRPLDVLEKSPAHRILILGAGDGLLIRDLLQKNGAIVKIDLIELDPEVLSLAKSHPVLRALNQNSLESPKVQIEINDAFEFVRKSEERYDLILIDLPHPVSFALSKVYSIEFYRNVRKRLNPGGSVILDGPTSGAENIIQNTIKAAGFKTQISYGQGNTFIFIESDPTNYNSSQLQALEALESQPSSNKINTIWSPKLPLLF
jgi:predicted membrane-bound spermidine synthase